MNNDAIHDEFDHVLSLVQKQFRDVSVLQQKRSALTAKGTAADGMVVVTVDAQNTVTETVIDDSYLKEFEFAELGGHITSAAQKAAEDIRQKSTALMAPLAERRNEISSLSSVVAGAPDFGELLAGLHAAANNPDGDGTHQSPPDQGTNDEWEQHSPFPSVKR